MTIRNYIGRIGGTALSDEDIVDLARHTLVLFTQNQTHTQQYQDLLATGVKVHVYGQSWITGGTAHDSLTLPHYSNLARYDSDRGHSQGDIYNDNNNLILKDSGGNLVTFNGTQFMIDFGSADALAYAVEAAETDWLGDSPYYSGGFYADNQATRYVPEFMQTADGTATTPTLYGNQDDWEAAKVWWMTNFAAEMAALDTEFMANVGATKYPTGAPGWLLLDESPTPFRILEEAFAVDPYRSDSDTQITSWDTGGLARQLDTISAMDNLQVIAFSQTKLDDLDTTTGTTNYTSAWGIYMTGREALWFGLGCYFLAMPRNGTSYFGFNLGNDYNKADLYFDEYAHLDFGIPLADWQYTGTSKTAATNLYWREMERGYVYVNPTVSNRTGISLPEACRPLTPANFTTEDKSTIATVTTFDLPACRAAFFLKPSYTARDVGRPYWDKATGAWVPSAGSDLYAVLADASEDTEIWTSSTAACEIRVLEPDSTSGVSQLRIRAKSANGNGLRVTVFDNSKIHAPIEVASRSFTGIGTSFQTLAVNFTTEELALIKEWDNLSVRLTPRAA